LEFAHLRDSIYPGDSHAPGSIDGHDDPYPFTDGDAQPDTNGHPDTNSHPDANTQPDADNRCCPDGHQHTGRRANEYIATAHCATASPAPATDEYTSAAPATHGYAATYLAAATHGYTRAHRNSLRSRLSLPVEEWY